MSTATPLRDVITIPESVSANDYVLKLTDGSIGLTALTCWVRGSRPAAAAEPAARAARPGPRQLRRGGPPNRLTGSVRGA
jgi:hypothetical protein